MKMLQYKGYWEYLDVNEASLFTIVVLPEAEGTFPTVISRRPYVDDMESKREEELVIWCMKEYEKWLHRGYAVVYQNCRGRGKSTGDFIPYIYEHEDSRALYEWIRKQTFYNGELFLRGNSYHSTVHFAAAPYDSDIKGAVLTKQDWERYNVCYRNGFMKKGLHGDWYIKQYKARSHMKKNYTAKTFDMLPLSEFTRTVFGEAVEDFDEMLKSPNPGDAFWQTSMGGADTRNATRDVPFPVLYYTGFYDIYTGGIFNMWNALSEDTRKKAALVVDPGDHGERSVYPFENSSIWKTFGKELDVDWCDYIRGKLPKPPLEQGKITYYRLFDKQWKSETFLEASEEMVIPLGDRTVSYVYNPYDPPSFKGGLSANFGGAQYQDKPNSRNDIISIYTDAFEKDTMIKGKMAAKLCVESDCEDTCFYVRISIQKDDGDYGLRDDITSLCYQLGDYTPGQAVMLDFSFDEHAFLIHRGEKLRIDIASADNEHYVRHTNQKGLFSQQTKAKIAHNTIDLKRSCIMLPIE